MPFVSLGGWLTLVGMPQPKVRPKRADPGEEEYIGEDASGVSDHELAVDQDELDADMHDLHDTNETDEAILDDESVASDDSEAVEVDDSEDVVAELGPEDALAEEKMLNDVAATDGYKENLAKRRGRYCTIFRRATASAADKNQPTIPVEDPDTSYGGAMDVKPCKNGLWFKVKGKKDNKMRLRRIKDVAIPKWGINHECDCDQCKKQVEFKNHCAGYTGKPSGMTRSNKTFKPNVGYTLGSGA
ncbi:hypothetical protein COCSADRAFT_28927 [Bipolaris sorokiniana ND90Pr]|uniref:Uncharacterized protein n=1 Tax=Cochliobolus sativus (strain ND90Pr / ATCC 201652) TaxID=665912 RepID=M2SXE4_COCSN|nr:uncharacterized protein COCSADRAFT_28927 [Bipolaris sorokiniana ND90Pr]EMD61596.1 hypothetical protein COCSADRAFT_28927 [Bipolaris sorokiniana ND90Pr]